MAQNFFLTGCASGMGRHLADVLQRRGDCVFATDRDGTALAEAARSLGWPDDRVRTRALDVTSPDDYEAAFAEAVEAFGHIDVLMNIAGLLLCAWVGETPLREVDAQIDVNVKGVIHGTQIAARHMVPRGSGHIINIASVAGLVAAPGLSTYSASKFACRAYSIAAAHELRPKGVYVTAICPATVQTPMLDKQLHNDAAEMFFSGRRILTLADIEHAVLHTALRKRPFEIHLPWWKGWFARFVDTFPRTAAWFAPIYQRSGRRRQATRRDGGA